MTLLETYAATRAAIALVDSDLPLVDGDGSVDHSAAYPDGWRTWSLDGGSTRTSARGTTGITTISPATLALRVYVPAGVGIGAAISELDALDAALRGQRLGDLIAGGVDGPFIGREADPDHPHGWLVAGINVDAEWIRTESIAAAPSSYGPWLDVGGSPITDVSGNPIQVTT